MVNLQYVKRHDYKSVDKFVIDFWTENNRFSYKDGWGKGKVIAIYRRGSTVRGTETNDPRSDIDYLIIVKSRKHSSYANNTYYSDSNYNCDVEQTMFTTADLQYPDKMDGRGDKIAFLLDKKDEPMKLLYGKDIFRKLLSKDLIKIAKRLNIPIPKRGQRLRHKIVADWL